MKQVYQLVVGSILLALFVDFPSADAVKVSPSAQTVEFAGTTTFTCSTDNPHKWYLYAGPQMSQVQLTQAQSSSHTLTVTHITMSYLAACVDEVAGEYSIGQVSPTQTQVIGR